MKNNINYNYTSDTFYHHATELTFIKSRSNSDNKIILFNEKVKHSKCDEFIKAISSDETLLNDITSYELKVDNMTSFGNIIIIDYRSRHADEIPLSLLINAMNRSVTIVGESDSIASFENKYSDYFGRDVRESDFEIYINNYFFNATKEISTTGITKWCSDFAYIEDCLYPKINVPILIENYLQSTENILILNGVPGTGKTTMIKKILQSFANFKEDDITVGYVKDKKILEDNQFWAGCVSNDYDVLVFDDLDDALLPRTNKSSDFVSNLLSFSDGVFDISTKIIITSNHAIGDVDSAIIRPGRCFDVLNMPPLSRDEAVNVWSNIFDMAPDTFNDIFGTDAQEITQAYIHSEYKRIKSELPKDYLNDQSISIRNEFIK